MWDSLGAGKAITATYDCTTAGFESAERGTLIRRSGPTRRTVAVDAELKRPASVFAGLLGLHVRLLGQGRLRPYEVVDRQKHDGHDVALLYAGTPVGCGVVDDSIVRACVWVGSVAGKSIVVALAAALHVAARVGAIARTESVRLMAGVTPTLEENIIRCDYSHITLRCVHPTGHLLPGASKPQSDNVAFCCRRLGGPTACDTKAPVNKKARSSPGSLHGRFGASR